MGIYEDIGVKPFINAKGEYFTRDGGALMPQVAIEAMAEAARDL